MRDVTSYKCQEIFKKKVGEGCNSLKMIRKYVEGTGGVGKLHCKASEEGLKIY